MEPAIFKPRLKFKPPLKFFKFGHRLQKYKDQNIRVFGKNWIHFDVELVSKSNVFWYCSFSLFKQKIEHFSLSKNVFKTVRKLNLQLLYWAKHLMNPSFMNGVSQFCSYCNIFGKKYFLMRFFTFSFCSLISKIKIYAIV